MSVERAELGKDETAFAVTVENTGAAEANLFNAIADATLTDDAGKRYFVRTLRTTLVDRIGREPTSRVGSCSSPCRLPPGGPR